MKENTRLSYYSFFTKYSLLDDYGFSAGLISRVFIKILPSLPEEGSFEFFIIKNKKELDVIINSIDFQNIERSYIAEELNVSIKALCSKISAFGLDNNIYSKFRFLELESDSFEALLTEINTLESCDEKRIQEFISLLEKIENNIHLLRIYKRKIGVNLHQTMTTRRILEYIERTKELLDLKLNLNSRNRWEEMIKSHLDYAKKKHSIRRFIERHLDLLALEVVEHTSTQGEKYIAENNKEYWRFFYKSMLGGAIISLFALAKVYFDSYQLEPLGYAFLFSLNYAICFILVKEIGGIIATKQPAMTASTIAKNIDRNDDLEIDSINVIVAVIKKALGSQFISLVGNFLMALIFAIVTFKIFQLGGVHDSLGIEPVNLMQEIMPTAQLIGFAAVAGFFLALSGLISGYIDNKTVVSKIAFRISNSRLFLNSSTLARFIQNRGGALIGNLSLGFFLGSAFLLSYLLPLPIDIRHIAFSSSYLGYSIVSQPFDNLIIIKAIIGVLLIGFTNFIVSFSITLLLTLKSRGAKTSLIPRLIAHSIKDFIRHPLDYFIVRKK